jgi:DNA polymerase-3 subunit delta'
VIVGHKKQLELLKNAARKNCLPHGLLFCGEEGIGKKSAAIELVKFINCESKQARPCYVCRNCQDIEKRSHPDFFLIEPRAEKSEIQISQIRNLIWSLSLKPYSSYFKIAIVDDAHLMNQEAQNCFLKMLEEPKGQALIIFVSSYPEMLLPTILSRLQKIRFHAPKESEIVEYLVAQKTSKEKIKEYLSFSLGKTSDLFKFLADPSKIERQKKAILDIQNLSQADLAIKMKYAKEIFGANEDTLPQQLKELLEIWLSYFRNILLGQISGKGNKSLYSFNKLKNIIKLIQNTIFLISRTNISQKLALEVLLMEI